MTKDPCNDSEPQKKGLSTEDLANSGQGVPSSSEKSPLRPDAPSQAAAPGVVHFSREDTRDARTDDRHIKSTPVDGPSQVTESEPMPATMSAGRPTSSPSSAHSPAAATAVASAKEPEERPLFAAEEATKLRSQWDAVQVGFVDEPRKAVQEADSLVAAAVKRLAEQFAEERSKLEAQWDRGGDVSTEDLRLALRRYRAFFGRLLSA
jgi:hypothetical protein